MAKKHNSVTLRKKNLSGGRISLYLDIYSHGERTYDILHLYLQPNDPNANSLTLALAERIRQEKEKEVLEISRRIALGIEHKYTSFQQFIQKKYPPNNKHTHVIYKHWERINGAESDFSRLYEDVERFMQWLKSKSIATQQNYSVFLRVWIKKACLESAIDAASRDAILRRISELTPPKQKRRLPKYLTDEELYKLCRTTPLPQDVSVARAFLFACMTGLRVSDVAILHPNQIDTSTKTLHYRQVKTQEDVFIPLSNAAIELCSQPDTHDRVFKVPTRKDGTTPLSHIINISLNRWASLAGVRKYITFHISRHTVATNLINNDVPIFTVKEILGHSSIGSTIIYTHLHTSKKREAINTLPALGLNKEIARDDESQAIESLKEQMRSIMAEIERLDKLRQGT